MNTLFLYRILFPNGKVYFGISTKPKNRFRQHKQDARNGSDCPLHRALRKYGVESIKLQVLVQGSKEYIQNLEVTAIRYFQTFDIVYGYNVHPGGTLGTMLNPMVAAKVSAALKGRPLTKATRVKLSAAHSGKALSAEHKMNIGDSLRGYRHSQDARERMSIAQRGLKKSSGWWSTSEGREKQRQNNHGNRSPRSLETRQKIREARAKQVVIAKMLAALAEGREKLNLRRIQGEDESLLGST